jgi:nitrogen fixation/metabolism regulation signal transduction histidine kinase
MNQKPYKRHRYFLLNTSQPRLLMGLEFIFCILLVFSGILFYIFANRDLTMAYFQAHLRIKNTMELLLPILVGINLLGLAVCSVFLLYYTHRIAGPAYRLGMVLKDVARGKLNGTVKFRNNDELKELEEIGSEMLAGLNLRMNNIKNTEVEIWQSISKLSEKHPELTDLSEIRAKIDHLHELLNEFELGSNQK